MEQIQLPVIDLTLVLTITVLFAWATALLLVDLFFIPTGKKRMTGYLAIAGLVAAAVVALAVGAQEQPAAAMGPDAPFGGMMVLDHFALVLTLIFLLVGGISIALSLDYLPRHNIERGEYYPLILFAVGGMILLAQGNNLIMLFLGLELLSITLYVLTAFAYPRLSSEEAGMKYLLLGAFAAGFFVYGIALIFGEAQSVHLGEIGAYLANSASENHTLLLAGGGLVLVALSFKVALVPFHMWTPDVYEGAPTPVTAFMSVGTKGAALAAMTRLLLLALPVLAPYWMPILGVLAALTMIVGNIGALTQTNVKRMLAYSSIGHAGYILLGIMAADTRGIEAFLFYLVAYALTNLGAFGVLIALEQRGETAWSLDDFAGLWKREGLLAVAMAVFMLSLAGMPPTAGFVGKFYVFAAAWDSGLSLLVLIGLLTSAIAVFFYLRVIVRMFMYEPEREMQPLRSRSVQLGIAVAVIGTLLVGLFPAPIVQMIQSGAAETTGLGDISHIAKVWYNL
jgi:NADH-quinone oxidoreductase subunit N